MTYQNQPPYGQPQQPGPPPGPYPPGPYPPGPPRMKEHLWLRLTIGCATVLVMVIMLIGATFLVAKRVMENEKEETPTPTSESGAQWTSW